MDRPARPVSHPAPWHRLCATLVLVLVAPLCSSCAAAPDSSEPGSESAHTGTGATLDAEAEAALNAAEALLAGISNADTALLAQVLLPESRLVAVSDDLAQPVRVSDATTFLSQMADPPATYLERMWNPVVRVDGPIATVWTPYDFYRDGAFSHCGIDAFHLVRRPDGWKVLSVIYSIHRDADCEPSPLGPPESGP
jgi:hypothetical protein